MKKTLFSFCSVVLMALSIASCSQAPKPMDAAAINAKADSVFNAGKQLLIDAATGNCVTAGAAKTKEVCDSICNANGVAM